MDGCIHFTAKQNFGQLGGIVEKIKSTFRRIVAPIYALNAVDQLLFVFHMILFSLVWTL